MMTIALLKLLKEPFCVLLCNLFNFAIEKSEFPSILKAGTITPIPKINNPKAIKEYRPITIQNPFSKIFDEALYDRFYSFFEKYNLLSPFQFGFTKGKGIEQATLNLMNNINRANKNNEYLVFIYIDLTNAFNSVNLNKLFRYGIRGDLLKFMESYLKDRTHRTKINDDVLSDELTSKSGVAQGTNLAPLLFNIFMNDVTQVIKDCNIYLYADDIILFKSGPDINAVIDCLQDNLNNFFEWVTMFDLNINYTKTKRMNFSRRETPNIPISINNNTIEIVHEYKYLGLTIDQKLTFKKHILNITKKVNQVNGKIFYLKRFLPTYILKKIYYSLIYSRLTQHILVWGGANPTHLYPLNVAVNKVIRNMLPSRDSTNDKYKKLEILTVNQIYQLRLAQFFYKSLILGKQQLLENVFEETIFDHRYSTRNVNNFRLPLLVTNVNKSFL